MLFAEKSVGIMDALGLFDTYFYVYIRRAGSLCGCNFLDKYFRFTTLTYMFGGSMVVAVICLTYTLATKDFETALTSLFGWGIVIQVIKVVVKVAYL